MYPGWMVIGTDDPFNDPLNTYIEIVNNPRAYAYARNSGLCWLEECNECESASVITPGGPDFLSPILDPAPWYDVDNPDSYGFLGVVGLDVSGDESSTRTSTVTMAITGGGIIGPQYLAPRTLIVRALAIAEDECSLAFGLDWLRGQHGTTGDPCTGDNLTFFDCCPCMCDDDQPGGPCWATNYAELRDGPSCDPDFWPATYAEIITGPPVDDPQWCDWISIYRELDTGPPSWSCCVDACVVPYLRQFYNVRVTEGPIVLQHPKLFSRGAVAEIEFTVVCADPERHALPIPGLRAVVNGSGAPITDEAVKPPNPSPFDTTVTRIPRTPSTPVHSEPAVTNWVREELTLASNLDMRTLSGFTPKFSVRTRGERASQVRIGLWHKNTRLGGYLLPYVPPYATVVIEGLSVYAIHGGGVEKLTTFAKDWEGKPWLRSMTLPHGDYRLTVDQPEGEAVELVVAVSTAAVGS